jgi:hypothetical protein
MKPAKGASRGRISPRERSSAHKRAQARGVVDNQRGELGEAAFIHKAISLGFVVAKPYGHNLPYDFIVEGGNGFRSVQIKACGNMRRGLYQTCISCRRHRVVVPYRESDVDFIVVYIIPEETWYVIPVRQVAVRTSVSFRPKGYPRGDPHACYREAWHLLREPDGLTFG